MKQPFNILRSTCVPLPVENIDTDQIMPARFLKTTSREGFAEHLFHDWRFDAEGNEIASCAFNRPEHRDARIIVAGRNFGCGSSREHAAWGIADAGYRAVISSFFADIHRNNELNNFVLPVTASQAFVDELLTCVAADPSTEVVIDLPTQTVTNTATGRTEPFEINAYKKECFLEALDDIDYLLKNRERITDYERRTGRLAADNHTN